MTRAAPGPWPAGAGWTAVAGWHGRHGDQLADVVRAVDGPRATVRGERPQDLSYTGAAEVLRPLWVAMRASARGGVLENVTLADLAAAMLPARVRRIAESDDAWRNP